ncbi:hypothetical protein [Methylobacterium sp. 77]|uniref:hypothetical protein n=1 Tax=Methylobacterium sp. 77 TaxID=1101192 RepID=UPI00039F20C4|nr:hypothetical protein [Methylobacterium sp. 77]
MLVLRHGLRAAVALGVFDAARGIDRLHRWRRGVLSRAGHEGGCGVVMTATVGIAVYVVAL